MDVLEEEKEEGDTVVAETVAIETVTKKILDTFLPHEVQGFSESKTPDDG